MIVFALRLEKTKLRGKEEEDENYKRTSGLYIVAVLIHARQAREETRDG